MSRAATPPSRLSPPAQSMLYAVALSMVPALALGLGRFGYSLLLPAMRAALGWNYLQASTLTTANAVGYLLGAACAARITARRSALAVTLGGCVLCASSLGACALSSSLVLLTVLRVLSGVAGAVAFVAAAGLAAHLAHTTGGPPGRVLGIYSGGAGAGIIAAIVATPDRPATWSTGWLTLGLLGTVCIAAVAAVAAKLRLIAPPLPASRLTSAERRRLRPLVVAYAVFGAGYIGYMTFIVALLRAQGRSTTTVLWFWAILGAAAILSVPVWTRLLRRVAAYPGPAFVMAVCGLGALLPAVDTSVPTALASALMFGGSFLAVVAAVANSARTLLPACAVTAAIGALTVAFSLGQSLGPLLGGLVADTNAGLRISLSLSALALFVTAIALGRSKMPARPATTDAPRPRVGDGPHT